MRHATTGHATRFRQTRGLVARGWRSAVDGHALPLVALVLLALGLRLIVWRWREFYPLGGDEQEYLDQALTLLRERRYVELQLMRPPLYTAFLAGSIFLFDSLVQRLRLIQEVISALTVVPMYGLAHTLFRSRPVALVAALLVALNYTLAAAATELLTETLFLFGLTTLFWLLLRARGQGAGDTRQETRDRRHETRDTRHETRDRRHETRDTRHETGGRQVRSYLQSPVSRLPSSVSRLPSSVSPVAWAALAGLIVGALTLVRSVALPLLPLGALWLLLGRTTNDERRATSDDRRATTDERRATTDERRTTNDERQTTNDKRRATNDEQLPTTRRASFGLSSFVFRPVTAATFLLAALLVILPWTARNYLTYGALILVDTTGAENLWLDNNLSDRDTVKQQLYALGDDQAARARLAQQQGLAVILGDPVRFLAKAWGEAKKFFALQHFDELREKRAIWVPPAEVWARLLLGDGLWLAILLGGAAGICLAPGARGQGAGDTRHETRDTRHETGRKVFQPSSFSLYPSAFSLQPSALRVLRSAFFDPRWLLIAWSLYVLLTGLIFHVELRYRLPLYPALAPYAAWCLLSMFGLAIRRRKPEPTDKALVVGGRWSVVGGLTLATVTVALLITMTLLHRPYPALALNLAGKHLRLWQAERALTAGDAAGARAAALAALEHDPDSALAQVALARAALLGGERATALDALAQAEAALEAHPHAHLLRGALLRDQDREQQARAELIYETGSLEDLQDWAWRAFAPLAAPPVALDVGGGLDLGFVRGFSAAEPGGFRWSGARSQLQLTNPGGPSALELRLASGRPAGAPAPTVAVLLEGQELGRFQLAPGWHSYRLDLPDTAARLELTLQSNTFRPRAYDPASRDNRTLGVMVDGVAVVPR